jgi:cytochrome P450 family 110
VHGRSEGSVTFPQGPRLPSVVQLLSYTVRPLQFLDACANQYGEIFTMRLAGYGQFVVISNTNHIEKIFAADPAVAHSGEANVSIFRDAVGTRSVLLLDEKPHARQRKLLMPSLHGDRMRAYLTTIRQTTLDVIDRWPTGQVVTIDESMREITLRVILHTVFGVNDNGQFQVLSDLIQNMLAETVTPLVLFGPLIPEGLRHLSPRWTRFLRNVNQLRALLSEIISRSRSSENLAKRSDVLAILLQARDEDGQPMVDEEICDELITLLLAGHDTTAAALSWAVREILSSPRVLHRIVDEVAPARHSDFSAAELAGFEYLDAAIKETLRLRTVVPLVVRLLKAPFSLGPWELPAGVRIAPCMHLVHHRSDLYPDPAVFRPARFLEKKYGPCEWFPFGGGNRRCLGMAFSLYEMKVLLSTLFSSLKLELVGEATVRPTRRGVLLTPKGGTKVIVLDRSRPSATSINHSEAKQIPA